ncbi:MULTISPECIES: HupE/UreJ family protein [unclassified Modicisalibacter]|uniref:HupE/UreJ family protein n=1 Tax=unclassified Modicisalibacter TaxID=2679913 RepID=UPI001CCEA74C|nr:MULTISPECIES: HupE/UreJ family protein [unclassified Modicisalibacter]MBZ9557117.1 HupE/UreJ family protein [Modicisalibacter sp. R2A 31.J]MBZ9574169.1 HupE/UreJ family protein [Modicisalibacter sp. MOD 31.J]
MPSQALSSRTLARFLAPAALLVSASALAHPGALGHTHGGSFLAGLLHPLTGLDHLLAMVAIGLWSVRQSSTLRRVMPLLIALGMIAGAALAWAGVPLVGVEFGIASSVLLAGILVACLVRLPTLAGGTLVFAFILLHGHAHGSELAPGASALTYAAGFLIASVTITLGGRLLGGWLERHDSRWVRGLGVAIAGAGGAMLMS